MAGRNWCFTFPAGPFVVIPFSWTAMEEFGLRYGVCQLEEAPTTGYEHFQGYMEFSKVVKLGSLKKRWPSAHFEPRRGTRDQARDYCMKEDTRKSGPYEFGDWSKGGQGTRNDIVSAMALVKDNVDEIEIAEAMPTVWLKYHRGLREYKRMRTVKRDFKTVVQVFYGPTGTGKSRRAYEENPDAYFKPRGDWWDGYAGQDTVVLDDFTGWLPYSFLLNLLDRYPLLVPFKGGFHQFTSRKVVITSNFRPSQWYTDKEKHPTAPLLRRIEEIIEFKKDENPLVTAEDLEKFLQETDISML